MKLLLALWLAMATALPARAAGREGPSLVAAPEETGMEAALEPAPTVPGDWVVERNVYATVYAAEKDRTVAVRMARHAAEAVPRLAEELGIPAGRAMHVYIAPNDTAFDAMQPGAPPDWADGTAWPHRALVYLRSPDIRAGNATSLEQVLDHEIVHVLLGQAFGERPVPRWLQEGMAKVLAREYTIGMTDALASGMLGDSLISLDSLAGGFPVDPVRAQLAYAQSADLVAFIRNEYGAESMRTMVRQMAGGASFGPAVYTATGRTVGQLDAEWQGHLRSSPLWLKPLTSDAFIWGLGALMFVVGGIGVLRKRKHRLAEMGRREEIEDAVYRRLRAELGMGGAPISDAENLPPEVKALLDRPVDHPWVH